MKNWEAWERCDNERSFAQSNAAKAIDKGQDWHAAYWLGMAAAFGIAGEYCMQIDGIEAGEGSK